MTDSPIVRVAQGTVRGSAEAGISRFLGIPYAQAPVGGLRFAAPAPPAPFDGDFDATLFGPSAPQFAPTGRATLAEHRSGDDWLTLNVWTPSSTVSAAQPAAPTAGADDQAPLPVMVWIHGGGYVTGTTAEPMYDGTALATLGVVLVTVNYRLGIEGFLHFPGDPAHPSNRGLLDQIAALTWVRDTIAQFGGDPGNVTVFGESAGAGSVQALLTMPAAAGLFRRAILQSPPPMFIDADVATNATQKFADIAGIDPTAQAFAQLSPQQCEGLMTQFAATQTQWIQEFGRAVGFTPLLVPVVDGTTLPTDPWQALAAGASGDVDVIVGHNQDEFRLFMAYDGREPDASTAQKSLALFGPAGAQQDYAALFPDAPAAQLYEHVQTDWAFTVPARGVAEALAKSRSPTYVYLVALDPTGGIGSAHGADVALLFNQFDNDLGRLMYPHGADAGVRAAGEAMRAAWVRFAATGDPGWPAWDDAHTLQVFGAESHTALDPFLHRWQLFADDPARSLGLGIPQ